MKAPAHPHQQRIDTYYHNLLEGDSNTDTDTDITTNQYDFDREWMVDPRVAFKEASDRQGN